MKQTKEVIPTHEMVNEIIDFASYVNEVVSHSLPGKSRHPLAVRARRVMKVWQRYKNLCTKAGTP